MLTTLIFWEAANKNSTTNRKIEKTAAGYGMEIGSKKSKILVNSMKLRP